MRCISSARGLELALRNPKITGFTQSGDPIYDGNYLKAEFIPGGASPYEAEQALKSLIFKGMYEGEDATERLSWFDTTLAQQHYGWTDDEREIAEERLRTHDALGRDFMIVEEPVPDLPWASYDTTPASDIADLMVATGTSVSTVLSYEVANRNRQSVIDAVEAVDTPAKKKSAEVVVNA